MLKKISLDNEERFLLYDNREVADGIISALAIDEVERETLEDIEYILETIVIHAKEKVEMITYLPTTYFRKRIFSEGYTTNRNDYA